jgi:hypothetical protein
MLSYARSEGMFAGVSLDGTVISVDDKSNASAYGVSGILASQIMEGKVATTPPAARAFTDSLTRATSAGTAAPAASPAATPAAPAGAQPAPTEEAAKTFPMEDPAPGAPPPQ